MHRHVSRVLQGQLGVGAGVDSAVANTITLVLPPHEEVVVLIDRDDDKSVCILQLYSSCAARLKTVTTQQEASYPSRTASLHRVTVFMAPPPPGYQLIILTAARGRGMYSTDSVINRREGETAPLVTEAPGASSMALYHSICQQQVQTKHWTALFHGSPRWPAQTRDAEERLLTAEIGREAAVTWSCSIVELHPEWRIRSTILLRPCNAVLVLSSSWRPRAG